MNWQKEFQARLADDIRLTQKKSRHAAGQGFFFREKEVANFTAPATVRIYLSPASVFALGSLAAEECILEVTPKGILVRLESPGDLAFAQQILERHFAEKLGGRRPEGKNARPGGWSAKRKATQYLEDAKALKALRELEPDAQK